MSDRTKAVNLTEDEINTLIANHGQKLYDDNKDMRIERLSYLNKRLKAFKEPDTEIQSKSETAAGWGTNNG